MQNLPHCHSGLPGETKKKIDCQSIVVVILEPVAIAIGSRPSFCYNHGREQ